MRSDASAAALDALSTLGPLRVWSVLVTVFGDLAPDGTVEGPVLSTLMTAIGIKPEATRVALHRLRSDGWITSQKAGRNSLHGLSDKGRRDSIAARPRIYGGVEDGKVNLFLLPDDAPSPDPARCAQIAPRLFATDTKADVPKGAMPLTPGTLPDWLGAHLETASLSEGYRDLHAVLLDIDEQLPEGTTLTPTEQAALRVLIVHAWRRLALKHPVLPRSAHGATWRAHDCRALVSRLLDRFPRPALDDIKPL